MIPPARRSDGSQSQRWLRGTPLMTWSTCWPQPDQVVFEQLRQVVGRHIGETSGVVAEYVRTILPILRQGRTSPSSTSAIR